MDKTMRNLVIIVPVILSVFYLFFHSKALLILSIVIGFLSVALAPSFKYHENLGVAFLTIICGPFLNFRLFIAAYRFLGFPTGFGDVCYFIIVIFAIVSVELISTGVVARLIWRKQKVFKFNLD